MGEEDLVERAMAQHGLVSRAQARAAGLTDRAIAGRLAAGRWRVLDRGVFVVGGAPASWQQRVLGTCLAGGPDVLASHRTAARLWDLVAADGRTEVTVVGSRRVRLARAKVHQSVLLPMIDRTVRQGIPVTTLPRTLADVAAGQDVAVVGRWVDEALRRHGMHLLDLRSCVARLTGPGRRDLRPILEALTVRLPGFHPGDSELEARALRAIARAGLPAPVQQHPVRRSDGRTARIDLAYPDLMVAVELDGWEHHGRRSAFDPDRLRRNELTLLGWQVFQFTASMPDNVLTSTLATALDRARRLRGGRPPSGDPFLSNVNRQGARSTEIQDG